jgi:hypothetical protein
LPKVCVEKGTFDFNNCDRITRESIPPDKLKLIFSSIGNVTNLSNVLLKSSAEKTFA